MDSNSSVALSDPYLLYRAYTNCFTMSRNPSSLLRDSFLVHHLIVASTPFHVPPSNRMEDIDYSPILLKQNQYQVQMNRTLLSVIAGVVCGIIRVEGVFNGLLMYMLWQILGSTLMWRFAIPSASSSLCFPNGTREIFQSQLFSGLMTFILVWTLVYDLVHIF